MVSFKIILLLALLALTQAQSFVEELPSCALDCVEYQSSRLNCNVTDSDCYCPEFESAFEPCLFKQCNVRGLLQSLNVSAVTCEFESVTTEHSRTSTKAGICLATLSLIFVIIRFLTKWDAKDIDDWSCLLAWICGAGATSMMVATDFTGATRAWYLLPIPTISKALLYLYCARLLGTLSIGLSKLSICFFLLRIFTAQGLNKGFRIYMWQLMIQIILCNITLCLVATLNCQPIHYAWTGFLRETPGKCAMAESRLYMEAIFSIVHDIMILAAPIWQIRKIQMQSTKAKIQSYAMFSVGIIATVLCAVRVDASFHEADKSFYVQLQNKPTILGPLMQAEVHSSIICACMPPARIFFIRVLPNFLRKHLPKSWLPKSWSVISSTGRSTSDPKCMLNGSSGQSSMPPASSLQTASWNDAGSSNGDDFVFALDNNQSEKEASVREMIRMGSPSTKDRGSWNTRQDK